MSTSVGQVHLDVGLNQSGLQRQISGLGKNNKKAFQQAGKSLGNSLGSTFSVAFGNILANLAQSALKSLGTLVTSSIELGSSIAELENVTSTVFPTMSGQVESFSKTAIQQYGLTEMQAKKMMGTFGAMAQAFNYSEQAAYGMSEQLTGLVGDVASFYNLDHDVAYTKIKSVFTGETESLKELGIVMTQTALDEFALQKGMGKTTKDMSEQEKVALRLAFVTDKLSFAQGDFAKTQHQWANQTRILSGQWDSFKAAIGQGFIAILTPVIQKLNELMATIVKLGEKFRDFIMLTTGKSGSTSGAGALAKEISDVTVAAADAAELSAGTASSAAKEVKKSIFGFDKLNKLADPDKSSTSASSISTPLASSGSSDTESKANSMVGVLDALKAKLEEVATWTGLDKLWKGIQDGVNAINFSSIKDNFTSIFDGLEPIYSAFLDSFGEVLRSKMGFIGTILGGIVTTAGKFIEVASGGVSQWLESESPVIEKWVSVTGKAIAKGFDNLKFSASKIFGSFWKALDENELSIQDSIANAMLALSTGAMTVGTIFSDMWEGLTAGLAQFVVDEESTINEFFSGTIESVTMLADSVSTIVGGIFTAIRGWWENDGKQIWNEIVGVFFDITTWVMKIWNEFVKPVIDELSKELNRLWENHLKPLWDNLLSFITSVWDLIKALWDKLLKPAVDWIIEYIVPVITDVVKAVMRIVGTLVGWIVDVVSGIIRSLKGIIDFITGVFTGDWEKAWTGIKDFFGGIWDMIWSSIKAAINLIIDGINILWSGLYGSLRQIINGVGGIVEKFGELIGQDDWGFSVPANAPQIPRLAEGGFVRANQPQLAVIGDNKRHGEIVAPEDKLYDIVSRALQAFMGQLISALNASGGTNRNADEALQLIVQIGEETIINRIIKLINAESRRQGSTVIKA